MAQDIKVKNKQINKLIQLDDKYELHESQKKKVSSVLQEQVHYLLEKKDKQAQKKKRLQQIEQDFQRKRKIKLQQFSLKSEQSEKFKERQIKQKIQKNKKNLEHFEKVNKKAYQQQRSIIQNGLERRKQFYTEESSTPKINTKAETQEDFRKNSKVKRLNEIKLEHSQTSRQMDSKKFDVENQMKQIEEKLQKAKQNQLLYQKKLINKLSQKQRRNSEILQKIRSDSMMEEQRSFKQLYGKNESILNAEQKVKQMTEKHMKDRRKSLQEKIKKMHQNIKFLQSEKTQKQTSLQNKLSKIYETQSSRLPSHTRSHYQQVMLNNMKLEEQKKLKAEEILRKHSEMTAKNKIYKEKKDQIFQAIKKVNPEV